MVANFVAAPTLAGMDMLSKRLAPFAPVMAVAEPTSMTWLPLSIALERAGCSLALVGNRHSARLRSALAGKNKSDPIDADMLSRAGEFFSLEPARIPDPRGAGLEAGLSAPREADRGRQPRLRRIISLARWAFPDVWNAFAGSRSTALAVLTRWPDLAQLARAGTSSISDVVAGHTRGVDNVDDRAVRIRSRGTGLGRVLGRPRRPGGVGLGDRRTARRLRRGRRPRRNGPPTWPDNAGNNCGVTTRCCCRCPAWGPITAPTVRAFLADGSQFDDAKQAQSFVGLNPSNWSSGQMTAPSRAITKEGPAVLRLAFYQAGNVARTVDPQLAEFYRRLMVERGHCHTQASCAVARKLVEGIHAGCSEKNSPAHDNMSASIGSDLFLPANAERSRSECRLPTNANEHPARPRRDRQRQPRHRRRLGHRHHRRERCQPLRQHVHPGQRRCGDEVGHHLPPDRTGSGVSRSRDG